MLTRLDFQFMEFAGAMSASLWKDVMNRMAGMEKLFC